jgi:2-iminobutanoate/2-iminopropanoate deaminase
VKRALVTGKAPAAIGPYSQAIDAGAAVYCSGQIALDPASGTLVEGGVAAEARRVLENLAAVLDGADLALGDVVKTTIYLVDLGDFPTVNEIYAEFFRPPYPARATVGVAALPKGAKIEIDAVAVRREE